jgi:hypothetical protein
MAAHLPHRPSDTVGRDVLAAFTNPPDWPAPPGLPGWNDAGVMLPADSHVHSEWSWDAPDGSRERTCARAVEMGLPAVAFTEHADYTAWEVAASDFAGHEQLTAFLTPDGTLTPPRLDLNGYLECVQSCRDQFLNLRVISGWSWAKRIGMAMSPQSCWMPDSSTGCSRPCTLCRWPAILRASGPVSAMASCRGDSGVPGRDTPSDREFGCVRGARPHRPPGALLAKTGWAVRSERVRGRVPSRIEDACC